MLALLLLLQVQDLTSDDIDVRARAVDALVGAGTRSIPDLVPLLKSDHAELVGRAEAVLARLGSAALEDLAKLDLPAAVRLARKIGAGRATGYLDDVRWLAAFDWSLEADLEVTRFTRDVLTCILFHPNGKDVDVLMLEVDADESIVFRRGSMRRVDYAALVGLLSKLASAELPPQRKFRSLAPGWWHVRAGTDYEEDHAASSRSVARVQAIVNAAHNAVAALETGPTQLAPKERHRLLATFAEDAPLFRLADHEPVMRREMVAALWLAPRGVCR